MKKLYIITFLFGLILFQEVNAQQDPQYTQYMYNMTVVNPAYAGSKEGLSVTALYRNQWSGIEDNPVTFTLSAHSPVGDKVGLGLSVINDQLGPVTETNAYADFSYTLEFGNNFKLALGLKGGATFHDVGLVDLELQDPNDPFFSEDISNTYFNFGTGLFLYNDNFYFGASVPNILESVHLDENGLQYGAEIQHWFLTAGYVFQVSDNVKLKPSGFVKTYFDGPVSFDANVNALFYEKFEIGASYRLDDSFSGLVGFQVTPSVRIGYAYDHVISDIKSVASSSHEVIITWNVFFNKRSLRSPRYF